MAAGADGAGDMSAPRWVRAREVTWRVVTATVGASFRYRVTGLAAEAAFFAILSLPPLIFALAGSIGFLVERFEVAQVEDFKDELLQLASQVLTEDAVNSVIARTIDDVFDRGRFDVISIGFVLALWSGSRALNVFVDTITIMYGLAGRRGIVRTRVLSFSLYVVGLVVGVVVLPLVLAGPQIVSGVLPARFDPLIQLYWPTVILLSIGFIASLYHLSVPVRTSWLHDVPGAVLALTIWVTGSYVLRWVLQTAVGGDSTSIYGPLAAPIAVLLWLYVSALAVLIGAALNAAFDRVWPESETASARLELVRRLRRAARMERLRGVGSAEEMEELTEIADTEDDWDLDEDRSDEQSSRMQQKPPARGHRRT